MKVKLSQREERKLQRIVRRPQDTWQLKRAQGLLALAEGEPWREVVRRLQVGRSTVYQWVERYRSRRSEPLAVRLRDRKRAGRPAKKRTVLTAELSDLMKRKPSEYGYRYAEWTVGLLVGHLQQTRGLLVGENTVRRALRALGYRWKRPRFVLRRRSPRWR